MAVLVFFCPDIETIIDSDLRLTLLLLWLLFLEGIGAPDVDTCPPSFREDNRLCLDFDLDKVCDPLMPALCFKLFTRLCLLLLSSILVLISFLNCLSFLSSSLRLSSEDVIETRGLSMLAAYSTDLNWSPPERVEFDAILFKSSALTFFDPALRLVLFDLLVDALSLLLPRLLSLDYLWSSTKIFSLSFPTLLPKCLASYSCSF